MVGYIVIFLRSLVNHAFVEKTFLNRVIHASQTFKHFPSRNDCDQTKCVCGYYWNQRRCILVLSSKRWQRHHYSCIIKLVMPYQQWCKTPIQTLNSKESCSVSVERNKTIPSSDTRNFAWFKKDSWGLYSYNIIFRL